MAENSNNLNSSTQDLLDKASEKINSVVDEIKNTFTGNSTAPAATVSPSGIVPANNIAEEIAQQDQLAARQNSSCWKRGALCILAILAIVAIAAGFFGTLLYYFKPALKKEMHKNRIAQIQFVQDHTSHPQKSHLTHRVPKSHGWFSFGSRPKETRRERVQSELISLLRTRLVADRLALNRYARKEKRGAAQKNDFHAQKQINILNGIVLVQHDKSGQPRFQQRPSCPIRRPRHHIVHPHVESHSHPNCHHKELHHPESSEGKFVPFYAGGKNFAMYVANKGDREKWLKRSEEYERAHREEIARASYGIFKNRPIDEHTHEEHAHHSISHSNPELHSSEHHHLRNIDIEVDEKDEHGHIIRREFMHVKA